MQKKVLGMAFAGLLLPALALASPPLLVRFGGHTVPMRETVQGWELAQMRELQLQMQQVRRIEAALEQPLFAIPPSVPVVLGA